MVLSPWRLSSWQLRPTFEATYRQTNRDHAAARVEFDTAHGRYQSAAQQLAQANTWTEQHRTDIEHAPKIDLRLDGDLHARTRAARHNPPEWALRTLNRSCLRREVWDRDGVPRPEGRGIERPDPKMVLA